MVKYSIPDNNTQLGNKVLLEIISKNLNLNYLEKAKKINLNDV